MDLLERYLHQVKARLDRKDRDDILRELSGNLRAEIEDREAQLGRPLTEAETEALLTAHGHPAVVAARYRPEQGQVVLGRRIIGPELFADYRRLLVIVGICDLAVGVFLAVLRAGPLDSVMWGVLRTFAFQISGATFVFAVAQRNLTEHPERWARTTRGERALAPRVSRPQLLLEVTVLAVLAVTWSALPAHPVIHHGGATLAAGPGWSRLIVAILALIGVQFVLGVIALARPSWTFRVISRMATNLLAIAVALIGRAAGPWFIASGEGRERVAFDRLAAIVNGSFNIIALIVVVASVALIIRDGLRLGRSRANTASNEVAQPTRSR